MRFSKLYQRLFINRNKENISMVNLRTKNIGIQLKKDRRQWIIDFKLFGKEEDRVASMSLTVDGNLYPQLDVQLQEGVNGPS